MNTVTPEISRLRIAKTHVAREPRGSIPNQGAPASAHRILHFVGRAVFMTCPIVSRGILALRSLFVFEKKNEKKVNDEMENISKLDLPAKIYRSSFNL